MPEHIPQASTSTHKIITLGLLTLVLAGIISSVIYFFVSGLIPTTHLTSLMILLISLTIGSSVLSMIGVTLYYRLQHRYHQPADSPPKIQPTKEATQSLKQKHHTILVVDDNAANRLVIERFLANYEVSTLSAENGHIAIELFESNNIDLVFMDIEMEPMNGLEVTTSIRQIEKQSGKRRTPIIGASAHSEQDKIHQALLYGLDDYFTKPIQESHIADALKRWCDISKDAPKIEQIPTIPDKGEVPLSSSDTTLPQYIDHSTIEKTVDIKMSLDLSNHNLQLAKDMLELLVKMIKQERNNIQRLYKDNDWEPLTLLVHKLHGGSCYCGVPKLQKACSSVDKQLQKNQYDNIDAMMEELLMTLDEIIEWDEQYDIDVIFDA